MQLLGATFSHMKKPYQLLIIPLTFWSGVEQGFFGADFTAVGDKLDLDTYRKLENSLIFLSLQGYITCAWGVQNVGYVLITYGVVDAICSASFGGFIKYVGRVPIFLGGAVLNLICVIVLFEWAPHPDQSYRFFIIAGLWGAADAVWQTQINGKIPTVVFAFTYTNSALKFAH